MAVLVLKNIEAEGPGTIGDYLAEKGVPMEVVELGRGDPVPPLEGFSAMVVLGGPMAVYEMDRYPHLVIASRLIREAVNRGMRLLGVCLGAQLIAHCLGARVYKGEVEESGWHHVELTAEGIKDPLMRKLALHPTVGDFWKRFMVLHWHGDTFELPMGAERLARSELYENQAFRCGDDIYAFQFHIEVTREMVRQWFAEHPLREGIEEETDRLYAEYEGRARNFYGGFFAPREGRKA
ncbi:MAG: type 1 glutamine amidotransferase [Thermodesulfovibrionales bacterium]